MPARSPKYAICLTSPSFFFVILGTPVYIVLVNITVCLYMRNMLSSHCNKLTYGLAVVATLWAEFLSIQWGPFELQNGEHLYPSINTCRSPKLAAKTSRNANNV